MAAGASLARSAFTTVDRMALCSVLRELGPSGPSLELGQISSVEREIAAYWLRGYKDDWRAFILKQKSAGDLTNGWLQSRMWLAAYDLEKGFSDLKSRRGRPTRITGLTRR